MAEDSYSIDELIAARYVIRTQEYRRIQGAHVDYLMKDILTVLGQDTATPGCLVVLHPDGRTTPIWKGWCEPAPLSVNPSKEEIDICKMLGYTLPVNILNKELIDARDI